MFDGGMASIDEQIAKPNPEFFKELIEHYSINPKNQSFLMTTISMF
ncbi:hypothetical protein HC766_02755 [Candidatus Gracilibacteria bacterium]|nr:hypothetical protein [Candidatus Gracilibacteria bacterium]